MKQWTHESKGNEIIDDVRKMIEACQRDKLHGPAVLYLPDSGIIELGGDPNDYPELEGFPGIRVVEYK